jgi:hypothetical protein
MAFLGFPFAAMTPKPYRLTGPREFLSAWARISSLLVLDFFVGIRMLLRTGLKHLLPKFFRPGEACACRSGPAGYGAGSTDASILAKCEIRSKRGRKIL